MAEPEAPKASPNMIDQALRDYKSIEDFKKEFYYKVHGPIRPRLWRFLFKYIPIKSNENMLL